MSIVKFSEVAHRANTKEDRFNTDKIYYVGGEHIESEELIIHDKGLIKGSTIGPMFYCGFKSGQILFVTRNPHLKKCGVAEFDGICSEKTFVIETKDRNVLLQEYLALVMQTDDFWDYCEENKSGGVNYFLNWSTLADYEFSLPSLPEQKALADKLWAAYRLKESYKKLLTATEEMVKSQFIEMFGSVDDNPKSYDVKKVGDFAECFAGATPSTKISSYWDNGIIPWMSSGEVHKGRVQDTDAKITQQGYDGCSTKMVPIHSIVVALAGQGKTRGTVAINDIELCTNQSLCAIVPNEEVNYEYLFHNLRGRYRELRSMSGDVDGRGGLNLKHIQSIKVILPPMSEQMKFVSIAHQADKSEFELRKSIDAIDAVIKSLINN
jgi:type I restriction enzyme S subunit